MSEETSRTVKIDGSEYMLDQLSETAKRQLTNLRVVDQKITSREQELAIFRAARTAFADALKAELPKS